MVRKVEYVFGPPRSRFGHSLGASALALDPGSNNSTLFSGGRDGRLCAWNVSLDSGVAPINAVDAHSNSVGALLWWKQRVFSCSADTTVKVWDPSSTGDNRAVTIGTHTDYAQCLAIEADHLVSGGLDSAVIGWDTTKCKEVYRFNVPCSIYSLAASPNLVITGGHDAMVRVWDPREGKQVAGLTGHTDTVREYLLEGDHLVSASSDTTIRLWSLTAGRTITMWTHHTDSVWSLNGTPTSFWSGDRSGNVFWVEGNEAQYRLTDVRGVKAIAYDDTRRHLWTAANAHPEIQLWAENDGKWNLQQATEGHPGLRKHRMLNDKRRALVVSSTGDVQMVDLVRAQAMPFNRTLPPKAMETPKAMEEALDSVLAEINTMDVLNNWCQVSIKAGQVCVVLDPLSLCNTEVYADELIEQDGEPGRAKEEKIDPEKRVQLGLVVLRSLLRPVVANLAKLYDETIKEEAANEKAAPEPVVPDQAPEDLSPGAEESTRRRLFNKILRRKGHNESNDEGHHISNIFHHHHHVTGSSPTSSTENTNNTSNSNTNTNTNTHQENGSDDHPQSNGEHHQGSNQEEQKLPTTFKESWDRVVKKHSFKTNPDDSLVAPMSGNTRVIVSEMGPGAGAPTELWQGTVDGLETDPNSILSVLPGWVGEVLMTGSIPARGPTNVGFSLKPQNPSDFDNVQLTPVIAGQTRLVATSMLRTRKVMNYAMTQLQSIGVLPNDETIEPESCIQVLCGDTVLSPRLTLAAIRTRVWRQGGDVVLTFRVIPKEQAADGSIENN